MILNKLNPFNLVIQGKKLKIIFTKHMLKKRKGDKSSRSAIIKTFGQVKDLIKYAVDNYGLYDFINKGHIVLTFSFNNEFYSLLLSIDKKEDYYILTLITLEKTGARHYVSHVSFLKEKYRIFMNDFIMHKSFYYNKIVLNESFNLKGHRIKIASNEYVSNKISELKNYLRGYESLFSRIISLCTKHSLFNKGMFWIKFNTFDTKDLYMKFAAEEGINKIIVFYIFNIIDKIPCGSNVKILDYDLGKSFGIVGYSRKNKNNFKIKILKKVSVKNDQSAITDNDFAHCEDFTKGCKKI